MKETRFTLRLPTNLYEQLRRIAKKSNRSINKQIVWWLERLIENEEAVSNMCIQDSQPDRLEKKSSE